MTGRSKVFFLLTVSTVLIIALSVAIATGIGHADEGILDVDPEIEVSRAKEIAIETAGVDPEDATVIRRELIKKDGGYAYDIVFYTASGDDSEEYEYSIDAETGEVLDSKKLVKSLRSITYNEPGGNERRSAVKAPSYIGVEKAAESALKDAGLTEGETDVSSVELKHKEGRAYYKVIFESEGINYEFHVDASNGKIILREVEYDEDDEEDEEED